MASFKHSNPSLATGLRLAQPMRGQLVCMRTKYKRHGGATKRHAAAPIVAHACARHDSDSKSWPIFKSNCTAAVNEAQNKATSGSTVACAVKGGRPIAESKTSGHSIRSKDTSTRTCLCQDNETVGLPSCSLAFFLPRLCTCCARACLLVEYLYEGRIWQNPFCCHIHFYPFILHS